MTEFKEKWHSVPKWLRIVIYTFLGIIGVGALGLVFGFLVQWLWNSLMPGIFGLPQITYWQSVGIVVLARLIFGSFGSGGESSEKKKEPKGGSCGRGNGGKQDWEYYDEWWDREGKKSFDEYAGGHREPKEN